MLLLQTLPLELLLNVLKENSTVAVYRAVELSMERMRQHPLLQRSKKSRGRTRTDAWKHGAAALMELTKGTTSPM
jgi:hypothetical protein